MKKWILPALAIGGAAYYFLTRPKAQDAPEEMTLTQALEPPRLVEESAIAPIQMEIAYTHDPRVVTVLQQTLSPEEYERAATDESYLQAVTDYASEQISAMEQAQ
jgi:hypothetical protein